MGTGQLLAGNLASLAITALAFLQIIPWEIAGYLIIGSVILVILGFLRSKHETSSGETLTEHAQTTSGTPMERPSRTLEKKAVERAAEHREPMPKTFTTKAQSKNAPGEEQPGEVRPGEGPESIGEGDYLSYDVDLKKGEEIVGEVSASGDVNVYVLNEDNMNALEADQEFWYEAGNEGVLNTTVRFSAPEDGVWYLVVENDNNREVNAIIKVSVGRSSHSIPSLKTDGLDLPDAKLEGKL